MGTFKPEEHTGSMGGPTGGPMGEPIKVAADAPSPAPARRVVVEKTERRESHEESVTIPGDPEVIAEETAQVSPEGRPGDPKTSPKGLRLEVLFGYFIVVCFAAALGWWVNPVAGVLALVIGTLAILFNPVVGATSQRANEREAVADNHKTDEPGTVVVRTTSKRQERRESRMM